jgi:hypothetical protein
MEIPLPHIKQRNDLFEVAIDPRNLVVTKKTVGRLLGYVDSETPEHFEEMIGDILIRLPLLCEIRAGYGIFNVTIPQDRHDGLNIDATFFNLDTIVTLQLKNSEKAALFACTIGPGMEDWRKQLEKDNDKVRAHLTDIVASAAVESATELLHDQIRIKMLEQGMKITNRYSPGYCGWSVAEQQLLFSLLPDRFCGITLTESSLMVPMKSISGIIGIGKNATRNDYACNQCGRKNCLYRESRRNAGKIN